MLVDQIFKGQEIQEYFKEKIIIKDRDVEFIKSKAD